MLPHEEPSGTKKQDPYVGKVFDKYRLIERLGAGGMGWVYRAEQARIKRHVAVKMLPFTMGNDEVNVKRIEREATAMGNLRHPNIATIFDFGFSDEGQPYLVMELISGRSLGSVLHEERTLEPLRAVRILAQIADAMDYAHKNNIIHRDLKPDNVMLTCEHRDDFVKILDFGIAKSVDNVVNVSQSLTRPGTVVGSPFYMSPEQCLGQKLDAGSDIYSFGVILYEVITGEVPCKGATIYETICKKSTEAPPPFPPQFAEWTELERLAQSCLAPMRADRPESMQIIRDRLNALLPATVDMALPNSVQISLTAESIVVAQHAAVSSVPVAVQPPTTDIYGAPLPPPAQPSDSVITSDGSRSDTDDQVHLQTPSQIFESIPEITEEQNTVVTSVVHDTANDLETPLASGIGLQAETAFATVSTGVTLPQKSQTRFGLKQKLAALVGVVVIAGGGLIWKMNAGTNATAGGVDESTPAPTTIAPVNSSKPEIVQPSKTIEPSESSVMHPDSISAPVPATPRDVRKPSAKPSQPKSPKATAKQRMKNRRAEPGRGPQARGQHGRGQGQGRKTAPGQLKRLFKNLIDRL